MACLIAEISKCCVAPRNLLAKFYQSSDWIQLKLLDSIIAAMKLWSEVVREIANKRRSTVLKNDIPNGGISPEKISNFFKKEMKGLFGASFPVAIFPNPQLPMFNP